MIGPYTHPSTRTSSKLQGIVGPTPPSVLAICVEYFPDPAAIGVCRVSTGGEAMELLRLLRFELVLVSLAVPDMKVWDLVKTIHRYWPWQKWALVCQQCAPDDEIQARSLGAVGLFSDPVAILKLLPDAVAKADADKSAMAAG